MLVLALALADRIAPVSPREIDDENLNQEVEHLSELKSQEAAPIAIPSQRDK